MQLKDIGQISKRSETKEGFLLVAANISTVGVQDYYRHEFEDDELPDDLKAISPNSIISLFRSEDEVFDIESMASFAGIPITDGHPNTFVNSKNVSDYQVGFSRDTVKKNDEYVRANLIIQKEDTILKIKNGKNQVSAGYDLKVDWKQGVYDGKEYLGLMTNIRGNHIAIVDAARSGKNVKLDDDKKEKLKMTVKIIDGISIEFSDQGIQAVSKLENKIVDLTSKIETNDSLINAKDTELADLKKSNETLKGELDAEKAKALDTNAIDALVTNRVALIDNAKKLHRDLDTANKTDLEIKKEAIIHAEDSFKLDDKSDEYVNAVFDTLISKVMPKDDLANALNDSSRIDDTDLAGKARQRFIDKQRSAWKPEEGKKEN
jgi:hypothetical protein